MKWDVIKREEDLIRLQKEYLTDPHLNYCRNVIEHILKNDHRPMIRVRLKPEVKVEHLPSYEARKKIKPWQDSIDQITQLRFAALVESQVLPLSI